MQVHGQVRLKLWCMWGLSSCAGGAHSHAHAGLKSRCRLEQRCIHHSPVTKASILCSYSSPSSCLFHGAGESLGKLHWCCMFVACVLRVCVLHSVLHVRGRGVAWMMLE